MIIETTNPSAAKPVFMVQIGEDKNKARSTSYPFEPSEEFLPIAQKINTILAFGSVRFPRELKSIASAFTLRG